MGRIKVKIPKGAQAASIILKNGQIPLTKEFNYQEIIAWVDIEKTDQGEIYCFVPEGLLPFQDEFVLGAAGMADMQKSISDEEYRVTHFTIVQVSFIVEKTESFGEGIDIEITVNP